MKKSRFTDEQIAFALRQAEGGVLAAVVCRKMGVSETFHKILKSGCKAEDLKLRTAERLTNLITIYCIFSWRAF